MQQWKSTASCIASNCMILNHFVIRSYLHLPGSVLTICFGTASLFIIHYLGCFRLSSLCTTSLWVSAANMLMLESPLFDSHCCAHFTCRHAFKQSRTAKPQSMSTTRQRGSATAARGRHNCLGISARGSSLTGLLLSVPSTRLA